MSKNQSHRARVLVSVLFHDAPDILEGFVRNVFHFMKLNECHLIVNISASMASNCQFIRVKDKLDLMRLPLCWLFDSSERRKYTADIGKAHIENFRHMVKYHSFDYIYFMASNCMLIKQFPKVEAITMNSLSDEYIDVLQFHSGSWVKKDFLSSQEFYKFCLLNKIAIRKLLLEGCLYDFRSFCFVTKLIEQHNLLPSGGIPNINDYPAEEYIFPSIYAWVNNALPPQLMYFDWEPTLETLVSLQNHDGLNTYALKRVHRNSADPLRIVIESGYLTIGGALD